MFKYTTPDGDVRGGKIAWHAFLALVVLTFVFGSFVIVSPGEKVIVTRLGTITRVLDNGPHLKLPWLEDAISVWVQIEKEQVETDAASQDLQTVKAVVAVNYQVDETKVADLWTSTGGSYKTKVIDPAIQEAVKAGTAKYTAEQLITQRPKVKEDILQSLKTILAPKDIIVTDVAITNFEFSPSFNQAIEAKVTAEQQALQAKNLLEQKKYEAEQTVVTAKAQAEAIQIQAQAIAQQGGANYVQIEAIKKWDGHLPQQFIPGSALPFLNLK